MVRSRIARARISLSPLAGRGLAGASLLVTLLAAAGCDRPVTVAFSGGGARDLSLRGEVGVSGTLERSLVIDGRTFEKGSACVVTTTFIMRRKPGDPPGYKLDGLYDPAVRREGFMLPDDSADTTYLCSLKPAFRPSIPVPREYFKRDP